ncbi:ribosomal protein S18-alanine N-acetyltransferase [Motilimonas sp. 1_MG-2023]|uniref:ribosomal protein S18-alanine N-acetyltransferase n=1 Tax=Motilimonas sp. 1_MG-2023 TaxID=3062672 RepID=UPI0026E34374|nr:ribosomal protein S18-alanine N-acetyltransferase [Motilimonas sp. 1_MG-2023]MDO6526408.1 ribosomal protein S18-alanine N-acetyltransferase [Motilimonas sp. 1_MG-2023]
MTDYSELCIMPMALNDLPQVIRIEAQAHAFPWSEKLFSSNFGTRYFNHVLSQDERVLGYYVASQAGVEATLLNIAIAPNEQGKGLGRKLLEHLLDHASTKQIEEIWLEVRESNQSAHHLYNELGFVEVDRRKGYYPTAEGREDAIVMCCYLDPVV